LKGMGCKATPIVVRVTSTEGPRLHFHALLTEILVEVYF